MTESTEKWKSDIKKAERIWKQLNGIVAGLSQINPEHVATSFARHYLGIAASQLGQNVMDEKLKFREGNRK